MSYKVLLITSSPPIRNLGGPSRFVPMLAEAVYASNFTSSIQLDVIMGGRLYKSLEFSNWSTSNHGEAKEKLVTIKKLMRLIFYSLYIPARFRLETLYHRQQRMYENIIKSNAYSVIHSHDYLSTVLSNRICKQLSIPLIFTNHFKGSLYREALAPTFSYFRTPKWKNFFCDIEKKAIFVANVLTFPSESARELLIGDYPELEGLIRKKSKVIYTGIPDPQVILGTAPCQHNIKSTPHFLVVNVGNHIPDKGVDLALCVFKQLLDLTGLDLHFINFGQHGAETKNLFALAKKLGIKQKVEFRGICPHNEILYYLKNAFVVLHTPRRVVFDLSLLESMAFGTPVIATHVKGNQEALGIDYPLFISLKEPRVTKEQVALLFERRHIFHKKLRVRYENMFTITKMVEAYVRLWIATAADAESCHKRGNFI